VSGRRFRLIGKFPPDTCQDGDHFTVYPRPDITVYPRPDTTRTFTSFFEKRVNEIANWKNNKNKKAL